MFFLLSKILWIFAVPANALAFLMLAGGLAVRSDHARLGWGLAGGGLAGLLVIGFLPVGTLLLRPLENRFPPPSADMAAPDGIVVLGGSTDETISDARDQPTIIDAATRLTTAVALARRYPAARIVFSGGSANLLLRPRTEAEDTRRLWISMGIAPERITLEDRSRNTDENARFTAALVRPGSGTRWLLVTSACHMPRAVGLFRAAGFPVIPYPVDYRTAGTAVDWLPQRELTIGLGRFDVALREWVGLLVYRATGRIGELFPAPEPP